jgi:hypothetical protein
MGQHNKIGDIIIGAPFVVWVGSAPPVSFSSLLSFSGPHAEGREGVAVTSTYTDALGRTPS